MIGDVLTTSILFEALRQKFPEAELHYAINKNTRPVVDNNPFIDKLIIITPEIEKSRLNLIRFSKTLKKENYNTVIDVYGKTSSNIMTWYTNAKTKISKYKHYTSFIYNHTFKNATTPKTKAGLAIENRLQLLEPLDIVINKVLKPKIYLTTAEKDVAKTFLTSNSINLEKPLYMISVLGSGLNKTYPFDYMASVINTIVLEQPNSQILFNYIPKQEEEAKAIYNLCSASTKKSIFFNVFGKSLKEFLAITHFCDALIGNEGGAVNMAKALNISTFTIFSPWIKKEAWSLFEDGIKNVSVHLKDYNPKLFEGKSTKNLRPEWKSLYQKFQPEFFTDKLKKFITQ